MAGFGRQTSSEPGSFNHKQLLKVRIPSNPTVSVDILQP